MRRAGLVAVGVTVGGLLLGGCGPAHHSLIGVWLDTDGRAMARVRPCDGDQSGSVRLRAYPDEREGGRGRRGHQAVNGWSAAALPALADTTFPLFAPPDAWHPDTVGPQRLLSNATYGLEFTAYEHEDFVDYVGEVTFSTDDLAGLERDEVWADGRAMSREAFDELVGDAC
ncbi:hypothetical protein OG885_14105 [Streptomyces sp. NBC_00028]|uniref:hypothetical protein n=1 Tax=Streptomyces sp. NBC_00028 TaxID=2975624 RepID=UPI0032453DF6